MLRPQGEESAQRVCAPQFRTVGQGNLECRGVSVRHLLVDDDRPGLGYRLGCGMPGEAHRALQWVGVPAGAPRAVPGNASAWVRTERDQAPRSRGPAPGAINPSRQTGAQQPEELRQTPTRRAGPGTKGFINSVWSGPRCLRRATSNPQRQHSLAGTFRRANHPYGQTRATGIVPPGFYGRKPWIKARQHSHYHRRRSNKRGRTAPPRGFPPNC